MNTAKPPLTSIQRANYALQNNCMIREICIMCGNKIKTLIFQGTGVCCENCRKDRDGDWEPAGGLVP